MNLSNQDFIYISLFFISVMLSIVFFLAWKTIERKRHTLMWALLFALAAMNGVLNALRGYFPSPESYWVVVNTGSLFASWLAWAGFRIRAQRSPYFLPVIAFIIVTEILLVWFTVIQHHMGIRMMLIPWVGGIMMFACAWEISHCGRQLRAAEIAAITLFIIYGMTQLSAGTVALMQGAEQDQYFLSIYSTINFLLMPASFTGLGIFTILILVDDLGSRMKLLAITDQLTGLFNRRGFDDAGKRLRRKAALNQLPVSILITDIDHFKKVNDTYGHLKGDEVLVAFARLLLHSVRRHDVIGRIGGEEFALILFDADAERAARVADSVRQTIEDHVLTADGMTFSITASFGVSQIEHNQQTIDQVITQADQALYQAKRQGRNQVRVYQTDQHGPETSLAGSV